MHASLRILLESNVEPTKDPFYDDLDDCSSDAGVISGVVFGDGLRATKVERRRGFRR